jgi:hypothetical protein
LGLPGLSTKIEESIAHDGEIDDPCKLWIEKMANAAENALTVRFSWTKTCYFLNRIIKIPLVIQSKLL